MTHILIVEDDSSISQLIQMTFKHTGFHPLCASGVKEARSILKSNSVDFAVIDIGLKDGLGYELVHHIKLQKIPFLFLTARGHLTEKIYGIDMGADDYIVKPFEPLELVARIKMILRRTDGLVSKVRRFGDLSLNTESRQVLVRNEPIALSPKEFELLEILTRTPERTYSRELLLESIWGYEAYGSTRTVDTHILTLRQKIGSTYIRTVYKVGYAFSGDPS